MKHLLITDGLDEKSLHRLKKYPHLEIELRNKTTAEELVQLGQKSDALIIRTATQLTKAVLEKLPKLKLVVRAGVGLDNIDVEFCQSRGISVFGTPGANADSAADLTLGLILCLARKIPAANETLKSETWTREPFLGTELRDKVLGIVGVGEVGSRVYSRAKAFGMKIKAYDIAHTHHQGDALCKSLDEALSACDFLTLHVPLDQTTRKMIGENELLKMKRGSFLINAARGGVIDEKALLKCLETGHIEGAACDVYSDEPISFPSRLVSHPNFIGTPHIGGLTREANERVCMQAAEQVIHYFNQLEGGSLS